MSCASLFLSGSCRIEDTGTHVFVGKRSMKLSFRTGRWIIGPRIPRATWILIRQMATIILAKECSFTLARMPEFKGTLPSLRLKWIRECVEDYEYIELMKKAGKSDVALELARQLGEDFRHWNADPKLLFAVRRRMGEALDKHLVNK